MDFKELKSINNINNQPAQKTKISEQKNFYAKKKQEKIKKEKTPNNPQYWQNALGIDKSKPSFCGANKQYTDFKLIDSEVTPEILQVVRLIFAESLKNKEPCIENTEEILKYLSEVAKNGTNTLTAYCGIMEENKSYTSDDSRYFDLTKTLFDSIKDFNPNYAEPISDLFKNSLFVNPKQFEDFKAHIQEVALDENATSEAKLAWIGFEIPLILSKNNNNPAVLRNEYREKFQSYTYLIDHFKNINDKNIITNIDLPEEEMLELSEMLDSKEVSAEVIIKLATDTLENNNSAEKELFISFAKSVHGIDNMSLLSLNPKDAFKDIINSIYFDENKLKLFNYVVSLNKDKNGLDVPSLNALLQEHTEFCLDLVDRLKEKPGEGKELFDSNITIFSALNILDENNIDDFLNFTKGQNVIESLSNIYLYKNPVTKKFDPKLIDCTDYIVKKTNLDQISASNIANEMIDLKTGKISPVAIKYINYVFFEDNSLKNKLLKRTGKFFKHKNLNPAKNAMDYDEIIHILRLLKNNEGKFDKKNWHHLKKFLPQFSCSDFWRLPELFTSLKDKNGTVNDDLASFALEIAKETNSYNNAVKVVDALKQYPQNIRKNIYETINNMKMERSFFYDSFFYIADFCFDEKGNVQPENIEFIEKISHYSNFFSFSESLSKMCKDSKDNRDFLIQIADSTDENDNYFLNDISSIYENFKTKNNKFPQDIKDKIISFVNDNLPLEYFNEIYNACIKENKFDQDTFVEVSNLMKKVMKKTILFGYGNDIFEMYAASKDNRSFIEHILDTIPYNYDLDLGEIARIYKSYKQDNNTFPEDIKDKITAFVQNNISLRYFCVYEACIDKENENTAVDNEVFKKIINYLKLVPNNYIRPNYLSPEIYAKIFKNNLDIKNLSFKEKTNILQELREIIGYCNKNNIQEYNYLNNIIVDIDNSININKNFIPVSDTDRNKFIANVLKVGTTEELTPFESVMVSSIPLLEGMKDGLPLAYGRKEFLEDLSDICNIDENALSVIKEKIGIEPIIDENSQYINITGYNGLICTDELDSTNETENRILECINSFMYENEVQTGNKELDTQLNFIIKAFPEFINTIGKKQHKTHKYTLDIHQLLVLAYSLNNPDYIKKLNSADKNILKLAAIFHDIMKQENVVDQGHQVPSSIYARSIAQKVMRNPEQKDRLYEIINNHHWLAEIANSNNQTETAKELAYKFRRANDFEIAKIMADSDLKAVSPQFYENHISALNEQTIQKIEDRLLQIYSSGNALFTDKIISPSLLNNHIEYKDGIAYKVINFHNIPNENDLCEYGFTSGITKNDARFLVHMVDSCNIYESLNTVKMLSSPLNGGVLSASLISPKHNKTYSKREYGVVLSAINTNIVNEDRINQGSGYEKDLSSVIFNIYNKDRIRSGYRTELLKKLAIPPEDVSDKEYADFYKTVLAPKTSIKEIPPSKTYKIGKFTFSGEELINAIKKYQDSLLDENNERHNEIIVYVPKIHAVIAKSKELSKVPDELLKFANENDCPVILI